MTEPGPELAPVSRHRTLRLLVLVVGLIGLAIAARAAQVSSADTTLPPAWVVALAFGMVSLSLSCSARGWAALVGGRDQHGAREAFYLSQLAKYVPAGGFVQAAGQVSLSTADDVPARRAALAYVVFAACSVTAGLTISAGLVVTDVPTIIRVAAGGGLLSLALQHRTVLAGALHLARRVSARLPEPDELPSQRSIIVAYGWAAASLALYSLAFTTLLRSLSPETPIVTTTLAFSLSWVIGFLAVPVPSGLGIRELVLVAAIPGIGAAPILAASLALRIAGLVAEGSTAAGHRLLRRVRRSAT